MDPVDYHLSLAILRWCGLAPGTYGAGYVLENMWTEAQPNIPYNSDGIRALLAALYDDPFFRSCGQAQNLTVTMLTPAGIVTYAELYANVKDCR